MEDLQNSSVTRCIIDGVCYYLNLSEKTAAVTRHDNDESKNRDFYKGAIVIPATITYNDEEYAVTSIDSSTFSGCTSMTFVSIPNSMTEIGCGAFGGCNALNKIFSLAPNPPKWSYGHFKDVDKEKCTLYVPKQSVDLYKANYEYLWNDFRKIVGLFGMDGEDVETLYDVYDMQGAKVGSGMLRTEMDDALPHGMYILVSPHSTHKVKI